MVCDINCYQPSNIVSNSPFGFSIFYLKAAAKNTITTQEIYRGVIPFVMLQLLTLFLVITFPKLITWLPDYFDK